MISSPRWTVARPGTSRRSRYRRLSAATHRAVRHHPPSGRSRGACFEERLLSRNEEREKEIRSWSIRAGVSPDSAVGSAPGIVVIALTRCPSAVAGSHAFCEASSLKWAASLATQDHGPSCSTPAAIQTLRGGAGDSRRWIRGRAGIRDAGFAVVLGICDDFYIPDHFSLDASTDARAGGVANRSMIRHETRWPEPCVRKRARSHFLEEDRGSSRRAQTTASKYRVVEAAREITREVSRAT
jgi:hypothetical protein